MIIELFGPPGSGKRTFAHALARRLREEGYHAKVALSHRPRKRGSSVDLGIFLAIFRIVSAIFSTLKILLSPRGRIKDLSTSLSMIKVMPPKKRIWRARLWQHILKLSRRWDEAKQSRDVVIFDQGYVQAIASLAMFSGTADKVALARALSLAPAADFTLRVVAPRAIVETRLQQRMEHEAPAERIFEADFDTNMRTFGVFQSINDILVGSDRKIIPIHTLNDQSSLEGIQYVERKIISKILQAGGGPAAKGDQGREILDGDQSNVDDRNDVKTVRTAASLAAADAVLSHSKDMRRSLGYASVFALLIYIGGAGLTSLAQLLIARLVGSTSYGIYSYVLAWTSVLGYLATLGFNVSLLRFVSAYRANGRLDLAHGVVRFALQRSLAAATLFGMIGAALIFFFSDPSHKELVLSQLLGMAAVPLVTACVLGGALIRAFGGGVSALLPERIVRDGLLLMLLGVAAFFGSWTLDAPLVMQAVLASSGITVGLVFIMAVKFQPPGLRHTQPSDASQEWWAAVPPIMLMAGLDVFISRAGVMVLGWTGHIRDAGIFALGLNVALLVSLALVAVCVMFSPAAAALHTRGDRKGLQQLFSRAAILSSSGAIAMAVPLIVIVKPLMNWFGDDFSTGAPIARALILGYVFVALCGPQLNLLTMTGHEWAAAVAMIVGAAAGIIGCAAGIELYGPLGAAIGLALSLVVWNVAMAIYISKRLKIMPALIFALMSFRTGAVDGRDRQRYWFLR
ncbi:MAG: exopolysaccharide biosynthesis protein [Mesorhizobium sp.]|uniref:lipopolysaccharide biosynthesis protein n=1 Tax=Mesorhizobium sp. TaxID=1871066 RepID=UPI000FE67A61|nr:polysaccharide biosynthesis C-terminal domain-containing protein [Mesorhizobium sp.]RWM21415.1 MAG: exopolysaccharide biosynthesis protein [Mesorhizobium sp.]TIP71733.1 MAG: exopolysaccharide biosynthesis protein [Mesorhizobium sp.]TIQ14627.1 MAG: exopolysaccharide biosynthesis protein [Mesorhizobium sp.]TIR52228.1 MAG: exopolysaccharide biosynthesis protein [Mesorhizobium sp.]TJV97113.1 MAG: exopolysaccharide biosynthesis protein [Mesorhizobium sp.]